MHTIEQTYWLLAGGAVLVLAGIVSSLIARRFGAPLLLVFLAIGMLAGVDGPGGIRFDDYSGTYRLGSLALAIILFDGGMRTPLAAVKRVLAPTLLLATVGVVLSAVLTGVAAHFLLRTDAVHSILVGAVVASTDAAAVLFLLRSGGLQLRERVGTTLEIESSANDPAAILLTTLLVEYLLAPGSVSAGGLLSEFAVQFVVGGVFGIAGGLAIAAGLARFQLGHALSALFAIASAVLVFGVTGYLGGSGFLAVYVAGLVAGRRVKTGLGSLLGTLDAATWLCQIVMFLVLGLLVSPHRLVDFLLPALGIAAFLMLVGRPLAVFLCLAPLRRYSRGELAFISWIGLRGAVGIFLASIPMLVHLPGAAMIFNVAFVVVLASLVVQGWTLGAAARLFGVALPHRERDVRRVELDLPGALEGELIGYPVPAGSAIMSGKSLPGWSRLALIVRGGEIRMPEDVTAIAPGDYAYLWTPPGRSSHLDWLFAAPEEAAAAEREMFGEFSLAANVPLGEIAGFYDLPVSVDDARSTIAEHFTRRYEHGVHVGDQVELGPFELVARDIEDGLVTRAGLKFIGVRGALARRRHSWWGRFRHGWTRFRRRGRH